MKACKELGYDTIKGVISPLDDWDMSMSIYVENRLQSGISDYDMGYWLNKNLEKFDISQGELADRIGVAQNYVSRHVKLVQLVEENIIPVGIASKMSEYQARAFKYEEQEIWGELGEWLQYYFDQKGELPSKERIEFYAQGLTKSKDVVNEDETLVHAPSRDKVEEQEDRTIIDYDDLVSVAPGGGLQFNLPQEEGPQDDIEEIPEDKIISVRKLSQDIEVKRADPEDVLKNWFEEKGFDIGLTATIQHLAHNTDMNELQSYHFVRDYKARNPDLFPEASEEDYEVHDMFERPLDEEATVITPNPEPEEIDEGIIKCPCPVCGAIMPTKKIDAFLDNVRGEINTETAEALKDMFLG